MLGGTVLLFKLSLGKLHAVSVAMNRSGVGIVQESGQAAAAETTDAGEPPGDRGGGDRPPAAEDKPRPSPARDKGASSGGEKAEATKEPEIRVYLTGEKRVETVPLETYVRGVIAAEMPIEFELEALKAQAIAARTYIVRRLERGDGSGVPVKGADVTDTIEHQVYVSLKELEDKWPEADRESSMRKLNDAVAETKGQIITYAGEPIEAVFFSTSNGHTENSEDYWQQKVPYLRSVASPWDEKLSPKYKETVELSLQAFYGKLGIAKKGRAKPAIRVTEKTEGGRIGRITIGETDFTGREVREKLGLASSQFTWRVKGDTIAITTYGYGHGVGMSQWGANGMAQEGRTAEDILRYYYTGTRVEQASKLPFVSNS
ncbi:stage II sporulation protein D [Paenibacillus sp. IB182493]|uniref:Stage II sporulation protein D n=2 Tax=Paenibacillus arenilitoris TaxID=2772299 RepID=A0A927CJP9_9BACL|nr:stage II sporulation protein D [Paenibacillus arenilitoris]